MYRVLRREGDGGGGGEEWETLCGCAGRRRWLDIVMGRLNV